MFPLSELSIQIVNALVISLLPPEPLPKLDFRDGIPADHATLVVVPMMLTSREAIRAEIEKLEVRFLGNRNAQYLLQSVFRFHRRAGIGGSPVTGNCSGQLATASPA